MTPIKVSASEFKTEIINFFEQHMSISDAKKKIVQAMKVDEYSNYIKVSNVRLFYSTNRNYAEGGVGFYLTNGKDVIKLQ